VPPLDVAPVPAQFPAPVVAPAAEVAPAQPAVPVQTLLRFAGVYLLTSGPQGPTAVPGLQLALDEAGVTLAKGDGTAVWSAPWDEIAELAWPERSKLPDGDSGVVVVITTRQQRAHRFVVPAAQPAALEAALDSLARRHQVAPPAVEHAQPAPLVIGAIAVAAVVIAVLLLAAGHIIHL
jgi:hypothetical protein